MTPFKSHRQRKAVMAKLSRKREVDFIISWEEGRLNDKNTIKLFQHLEKTGRAYTLQGNYGRTAVRLIGAGLIKPNFKIHSKEQINSFKQRHNIQKQFNDF